MITPVRTECGDTRKFCVQRLALPRLVETIARGGSVLRRARTCRGAPTRAVRVRPPRGWRGTLDAKGSAMSSTVTLSVLIVVLCAVVVAYLWPRPEVRFEKLFVATLGALIGSLLGRVFFDPRWVGHLAYVAAGAFAFSALDWISRRHRPMH